MLRTDWTFDRFVEDSKKYSATPIKGVYSSSDADYRESFMRWFKNEARDFEADWMKTHKSLYDRYDGWIGDAFAERLSDMCFSDIYKDAYNQRPHLPSWYYIHAVGLPMEEDTSRMFCASPVEDAVENAKMMRKMMSR